MPITSHPTCPSTNFLEARKLDLPDICLLDPLKGIKSAKVSPESYIFPMLGGAKIKFTEGRGPYAPHPPGCSCLRWVQYG